MSQRTTTSTLLAILLAMLLAGTAGAQPPTANLVGYWPLDDEGTGMAQDHSGNDYHGTLVNQTHFQPGGVSGECAYFDGTNDRIELRGWQGILGGQARTISCWIKTTNTSTDLTIMSWGPNGGTAERLDFRLYQGRLRWEHSDGNIQADTNVVDGTWHHVALVLQENATCSYGDSLFYVDGQDDTRNTSDPDVTNTLSGGNPPAIGIRSYNNSRDWEGWIDEVRVYDRALTAEEIGELAKWPRSHEPSPPDNSAHQQEHAVLTWIPGGFAAAHDVYLSKNRDEVLMRTPAANLGRQTADFVYLAAGELELGNYYYWRVDDVAGDGVTIRPGAVWSFLVPEKTAYWPDPADAVEQYVDPNLTMSWSQGMASILHELYFGESFDDVNADDADGSTYMGLQASTSYTPPETLKPETTYYWRVDETDETFQKHKGAVWSFRTRHEPTVTDPSLIGWWTLDEGTGSNAVDWSGHGNHSPIRGGAQWVDPGWIGDAALNFDGLDDYIPIDNLIYDSNALPEVTVCAWVRTIYSGTQSIASFDRSEYWRLEMDGNGGGPGQIGWSVMTDAGQMDMGSFARVDDGYWHHITAIYDDGKASIYIDGRLDSWYWMGTTFGTEMVRYGFIASQSEAGSFDGNPGGTPNRFNGDLDDVRIYDKALTAEEIALVMRGDPLLAWKPDPANYATPQIQSLTQLSWAPGDMASQHDVYWGSSRSDVTDADTSSPEYKGRRSQTTYPLAGLVEFGSGPHYWRIDEVNTDSTITKGRVWTFTVANYLLIDDIEDYNNFSPDTVWEAWIDGWGNASNGSLIGHPDPNFDAGENYVETGIVHGGRQSMPYYYDNNLKYSEATLTLTGDKRNWTVEGMNTLSIWHYGYPASVASFIEDPAGTYTMVSAGLNIYGTEDSFTFAWKSLNGEGSITARVDSVENTNANARAGLMIRDSLDPDSVNAITFVRADSTIRFNRRTAVGATTDSENPGAISMPHWLKIERDLSGMITAYHANDVGGVPDATWTQFSTGPLSIQMDTPMYIGLASSANAGGTAGTSVFSNVTTTGNVTGASFTYQDIGIQSNEPEPMYVVVKDAAGQVGEALNPDPDAVLVDAWTEWNIVLADEFQGVDLSNVDTISLRFGTPGNNQPGGTGLMYFDTIRLYGSRCFPDIVKPALDFSNNCVVDMADLEIMTDNWLSQPPQMAETVWDGAWSNTDVGTTDPAGSFTIDGAGNFTIVGAGADIWGIEDGFHFASQALSGDGQITVRINSIDNTNAWSKAGVMIRDTMDPNSAHAQMIIAGTAGAAFQWRSQAGGTSSSNSIGGLSAPICLSIARTGDTLTGYYSTPYGWVQAGSVEIAMADPVRIGIAVTSHNDGTACTATGDRDCLPLVLETDTNGDGTTNFMDYAALIDSWLDEQLWP